MTNYVRRTRRNDHKKKILIGVTVALLVVLLAVLIVLIVKGNSEEVTPDVIITEEGETTSSVADTGENESAGPQEIKVGLDAVYTGPYKDVLTEANRHACMYDYDAAINYVKNEVPTYESVTELTDFIYQCEAIKSKLVKWADNSKITHVFFHTLIYDTDVAFASYEADDYNQVMTTIDEFNKIIQQMYDGGYVLVRLSDIASINESTNQMQYNPIYLPEGKKPFVLSEDDVSYYEYMKETGGYANRLVVDENGKVVNEVDEKDGSKTRGAFDVAPLLDEFVEKHPDFSYHGAKGILALTGYNGILGYRTSYIAYGTAEDYQKHYQELFVSDKFDEAHAVDLAHGAHLYDNANIEADRKTATEVAKALRENGWEFASHTWGHMDMGSVVDQNTGNVIAERFYRDAQWWDAEVRPLLGDVDTIIFARGADIATWRGYTDDNQAYNHLKSIGFDYYCNVDSSQYYVQMTPSAGGNGSLRQGRRNLDGMLMFKAMVYPEKKLLDDIFDVWSVFDFKARPLPVVGVTLPEGMTELTKPDGTKIPINNAGNAAAVKQSSAAPGTTAATGTTAASGTTAAAGTTAQTP